MDWLLYFLASIAGSLMTFLFIILMARPFIKRFTAAFMKILMKDRYTENIWEMVSAFIRLSPRITIENSLRAANGGIIERPFGSPKKFLHFDGLMFSPAQLAVLPTDGETDIKTETVIGPRAKRPLVLDIPVILGGMAYGVGVSDKVKIAQAWGTGIVGSATNIGEGTLLPEEREKAKYIFVQYHSAKWAKEREIFEQADAIEIHIGQGASAAVPAKIPPETLSGKARDILGLKPGETAELPRKIKEIKRPKDLKKIVQELKEITDGVPVGIKICAGNQLEKDMEIGIEAGVDFISIDGGQAGTKGSPPIIQDDFGLPTIYALSRAVRYLEEGDAKNKISLLVGGGFYTPGDCLKAIALGADAVYLGTAALWAMTHTQVAKTVPFEPPTTLVFYPGRFKDQFNTEEAAYSLANFLSAFTEEMKIATIALGKKSIRDVDRSDLVALDELTSKVTNIPTAY
ncbi:FMN-binding glutamate synthase family protein [Aeribacillus alveayuensis]|uniref:Glutamate synthase domain-containing protein 2 n=1 Tax=Aeribacillus alveayuensis TaxID=279215 RepID=A0ABT9VME3_9BACI|nr:glutamate synthase domain-containing protein 2 [Bacillus alveayuensis]